MGEEKRLVHSEYAGAALGDQRLNSRLQKIAGTLEANPDVGFPNAMTEAELEAFYRFLSNDRVEPERILAPHVQATLGRWKGQDTVLCVQPILPCRRSVVTLKSCFWGFRESSRSRCCSS